MFTPARKSMPPIDYVSIVRSVYENRRAMLLGALVCILGTLAGAVKTGSPIFWALTAGFVLLTIYRYVDMTLFQRVEIRPSDIDTAARWELRATYGAAAWATLAGLWCFSCFAVVRDPSTEIIAMVATIGCLVGIVARNFGLDRMLTIQLGIVAAFVAIGLLLRNDPYHWVLAAFMLPMLVSYRFLAADVRAILLAAVHGRVEASRLADELDTALDTMQHGLCMLDKDGTIAVVNERVLAIFAQLAPSDWQGKPFRDFIGAAMASGTLAPDCAEELLRSNGKHAASKVMLRLDKERNYEVTVSSDYGRTVLLFEDISERVKAADRITFMARYDALTGLPNRGYFTEQVETDLARWHNRQTTEMVTLMIIDVDDFKHVNDTQGHLIGDRLLIEAAERLRQALGDRSIIARLGGDEFIVYRAGAQTDEQVMGDAHTVMAAFRAPFGLMGEHLSINVSIGTVTSGIRDDDLSTLMTKADLALYKAKSRGKAQYQMFRDDMDVDYRYRQRLKAELREAIAGGGLSLAYQPVIDIKTKKVVGCEALARWHHPELGTIPPSVFIPIAEESGLVSEISRWVLATATAECQNWPENVGVAVNISAKDLRAGDVAQMVNTALASSGLPPHRLEIEVTETAVIEEREAATLIFKTLTAQGIGIALDDFGTGYSSLSYLQALPFTKLKIDRSFVRDIADSPRSLKLLSNVAQLGKDIGLTITAEGIETEEQLALVAAHTNIDQIQGYLFGVPLPRREVFELIVRLSNAPPESTAASKRKHG
ncbi:MAG TPA: EAL domain-containing protein [Devosiaceae bacterium]|nr:EAL domain-containing protein [Devosiaceae bacterium]